ncbi:MAG TPA: hypothetical protein VGC91_04235 [Pyrinomonadaceae bacterium]|jgi:hypothetical protein
MSEQDDRDNAPEEGKRGNTGDIKPPTREEDEPPATGSASRDTGDIKPPTE